MLDGTLTLEDVAMMNAVLDKADEGRNNG